jgi:hypothetical protein
LTSAAWCRKELAHVWLHDPADGTHHRGTAEVEAESVAYIVCHAAGLDTGDYTLPYVAVWADGDVATVRATAERVLAAAKRAIEAAGLDEAAGEQAA